ncbi:uncharacterized protein C1orf127 homolog [Anomaloglossus baeobatrachus]
MELGVPGRQMDGLLLWLSRVMRFPVSLSSLDRSNRLIARCRYALDVDSNGDFIFRVHYSACNVQAQNGFHVLEIHMVRKSSPGNGRSDRYRMRCPAVTAAMGREKVRCDPDYIQVSRPMPLDNADDRGWFLLFRGEIEVSVGDASLIGVEIEMNKSHVTVKGLRDLLLSTREFLDRQIEVLPLWIGNGIYVYSLEATCPSVTPGPGAEVMLPIPKQRMGLVKRGSYMTETLTLKNIVVLHPINVTVTENKHFVIVNVPAAGILRSQDCTTQNNRRGIQVFYTVDLVLEFAEIAHPMNWTLENYYECTVLTANTDQKETDSKKNEKVELSANNRATDAATEENNVSQSYKGYPLPSGADLSRSGNITSTVKEEMNGSFTEGSGDSDVSGSGDGQESSDQINATQLAELGNTMVNFTNGSRTLVTEQPDMLQILSAAPERLQDEHGNISNSTVTDASKNRRPSSNMSSILATTTCSHEVGRKKTTSNMEPSEETRWTVVHSGITKEGSAVTKQKDSTKPRNSQHISDKQNPSLEKKPKDDADLWEALIGESLLELLHETTRDEFASPMYRHRASSSRKDPGSLEKTKRGKVLEKTIDETSASSVRRQRRSVRELQHPAEDGILSSSHTDWWTYRRPHEDLIYNTRSDIETIRSAEQLIVEV